MSDPDFDIISASSGAVPVAAGGTITFQYPPGRARAVYMDAGARAVLGVRSSQAIYNPDTDFSVAFNSDVIVVTFLAATPIPANVPVSLQAPIRDTSGSPSAGSTDDGNEFGVPAEVFPQGL